MFATVFPLATILPLTVLVALNMHILGKPSVPYGRGWNFCKRRDGTGNLGPSALTLAGVLLQQIQRQSFPNINNGENVTYFWGYCKN